jgi:metal-responsive CopG/Arc/MetJ family transcriptional regulator
MRNNLKITISLPKEDFYQLEQIRKELGLSRSGILNKAIRFWLGHHKQEELIKRYRKGYRRKPESIQEIEALEQASADAVKDDGLQ